MNQKTNEQDVLIADFNDLLNDAFGANKPSERIAARKALVDAYRRALATPAPLSDEPVALPRLKPRLLAQLRRFNECCEDPQAGGHDVDKEDMHSLAEFGAVRPAPGGRHYLTDFGAYVLAATPATPATPSDKQEAVARYIVIGYGETDHPQAAFVNEREQLLDAVLGMEYMDPRDADTDAIAAYRESLADDDQWSNEGIWRTEFEIGGIVVYDLGCAAPPAQSAEQDRIDAERMQALEADKARLDSGCIMTTDYDDFGDRTVTERRGLNLRAAIDAAIAKGASK
jgi:hypothetical protein